MLKELLKPEIKELIEMHKWSQLKEALNSWPAAEIADLLLDIDKYGRVLLFRALPRDLAAEVFSHFEHEQREALLYELTDQETKNLLADMSPDDRTSLLEELPAKVTRTLLNLLSPEDLKEARELLGYPEDSIGRLMTPDFVAVKSHWTVAQTLEHIRKFGKDSETFNRVFVTDNDGKLLDEIPLRNIILANAETNIESLMDYNVVSVSAFDDQEEAVRSMEKYDISVLPAVDSEGKLVGIVTFDDVMDVAVEEATEDMLKISAVSNIEEPYVDASFWKLIKKRAVWLSVLFLGESFTATAMGYFENEISKAVVLALFIPLIISSGGNSGSQASTLVIRALALGELTIKDWFRVFKREILSGITLGSILAVIGFFRIAIWQQFSNIYGEHWLWIAITVSFALIGVVLWGTVVGSMLPILLRSFKLDPAVSSSPFIATLVDVTGIIIYFSIAILILGNFIL